MVDSYLWLNTPTQMISCTDTDEKITPLRFRFRDRDESIVAVTIDRIISTDQGSYKIGPTFECYCRFAIPRRDGIMHICV